MATLRRWNSLPDVYDIGCDSDEDGDELGHNSSLPNMARSGISSATMSRSGSMGDDAGAGGVHDSNHGNDWDGGERVRRGLGGGDLELFFIWLDPSDPCAERIHEWPLPHKYQTHVRRWEERYQVNAQVYSGHKCLEMVRRVNSDCDADCVGLLDVYLTLAERGNWIKMVDIARVAIIYLEGGMYLDTDMDLGPRTFSREELLDPQTCYLVHDADGALQNHFFRAPKRHAFMRHMLHVLKVNALLEEHVVQATGPCALTAALSCFHYSRINISLPSPPAEMRRDKDRTHAKAAACGGGGGGEGAAQAASGEGDGEEEEEEEEKEGEGEEEEDIFSKGQMEALTARVRRRLAESGYELNHCPPPPPASAATPSGGRADARGAVHVEGMVGHEDGGGWRAGPGVSEIVIYPPAAFYLIHWRECRDLAMYRSASQCFAIHNWDTTWAPQLLLSAGRPYTWYCGLGGLQGHKAALYGAFSYLYADSISAVAAAPMKTDDDCLATADGDEVAGGSRGRGWEGGGEGAHGPYRHALMEEMDMSAGGGRSVGALGGPVSEGPSLECRSTSDPLPGADPSADNGHLHGSDDDSGALVQFRQFLIPADSVPAGGEASFGSGGMLPRSSSISRVPSIPDYIMEEDEEEAHAGSETSDDGEEGLSLSQFHLQMLLDVTKDLSG